MVQPDLVRRRDLPHWDVPSAAYFITTCLEGSIPARGRLDLQAYRAELKRRRPPADMSKQQWSKHLAKLAFAHTDEWLDRKPVVRHLADPQLARIVVDSLYFFAGKRYQLLAFAVMPSHYHWAFQPLQEWLSSPAGPRMQTPRERIVQSVNTYTARKCNGLLGVHGPFWQHESYDHWIRDGEELERIIHYIEGNPVKAGLSQRPEEWPFSSAHDRFRLGQEIGEPLVRRESTGKTELRPHRRLSWGRSSALPLAKAPALAKGRMPVGPCLSRVCGQSRSFAPTGVFRGGKALLCPSPKRPLWRKA